MKSVSLNGEWLYQIGGGEQSQVTVPFSRLPVGRSVCTRLFDMTERADRIFLKLDGITYYASVFLNDVFLGEMLPYSEYEFEITDVAREKDNVLTVELDDIGRAYGPSEGWENFGGIIRDVSLIYRNENYIKNVFFKSELWDDLGGAEVCCEMDSDCSEGGIYEIILYDGEEIVLSYQQASNEIKKIAFDDVKLWSPDTPALYSIEVTLICGDEICDTYSCKVGFKKLLCDRHRFVLNGKPLFLRGVCKHEMVADSGHCPSLEQMEKDMRMIKEMGCNFVRLVHYPHNKRILEIADRLGLMVSEEPGLWWSDTANEEIANGSQEVLRRTILRDRNHVSVAFWLCFNECMFTEQFLIDSAAICRRYDPTRLVSGANCMSDEDTLIYYNKCGFDFYTMHPYSDTFERAKRSAKILFDKPLVFTEWGGYHVYDNPHLLSDFMIEMHRLYLNNSDDGALAGAFFWFFC